MSLKSTVSPQPMLRDVADRLRVKALLVVRINAAIADRDKADAGGGAADRNFHNGRLDCLLEIWGELVSVERP